MTAPPVAVPQPLPTARILGVAEEEPAKSDAKQTNNKTPMRRDLRAIAPAVKPAFDREIRQAAANYRIDPLLLHALVETESAYRPDGVSRAGALGLMQIMPGTGAMLGVDRSSLLEPETNLDTGARYLKDLQQRYGRDLTLILSAYNAGPGAVERYGRSIPPFRETRAYVAKVMGRYGELRLAQVMAVEGAPK